MIGKELYTGSNRRNIEDAMNVFKMLESDITLNDKFKKTKRSLVSATSM